MTNIAGYKIGFDIETTYGTRARAAPTSDTQVWVFGSITKALPSIPTEEKEYVPIGAFDSFNVNDLVVGKKFVPFTIEYALLEGIRLYYALGTETKGGAGPTYTHTITEREPSTHSVLPSCSIHLEADLTTDIIIDMCGMVVQQMDLSWLNTQPSFLSCKETLVGQRITTNEAGYTSYNLDGTADGDSSEKAVAYSANDPSLVDTSLTRENNFYCKEIKLGGSGGTDYIADVQAVHITIQNELIPCRDNRTGTDNYGRSINHYPSCYLLKDRSYQVAVTYKMTDTNTPFYTAFQQETADNDVYIKFERDVGGVTHSIVFNFDTAITPATSLKGPLLHHSPDENKTIIFQPKSIVSIVVTDEQNVDYSSY